VDTGPLPPCRSSGGAVSTLFPGLRCLQAHVLPGRAPVLPSRALRGSGAFRGRIPVFPQGDPGLCSSLGIRTWPRLLARPSGFLPLGRWVLHGVCKISSLPFTTPGFCLASSGWLRENMMRVPDLFKGPGCLVWPRRIIVFPTAGMFSSRGRAGLDSRCLRVRLAATPVRLTPRPAHCMADVFRKGDGVHAEGASSIGASGSFAVPGAGCLPLLFRLISGSRGRRNPAVSVVSWSIPQGFGPGDACPAPSLASVLSCPSRRSRRAGSGDHWRSVNSTDVSLAA